MAQISYGILGASQPATEFVKAIFREIHEESVRQQMIIMNEQA